MWCCKPAHPAGPVELAAAQARLAELPLDRVPDAAPLPGSWMPLSANPHFVGRTAELQTLARAAPPGWQRRSDVIRRDILRRDPSVAATGLGGICGTQLASAFVHRYGQYFLGGVFWLSWPMRPRWKPKPPAAPNGWAICRRAWRALSVLNRRNWCGGRGNRCRRAAGL
ncbi:MAG: hypothetical protein R2911_19990 [Caldilineaceae bacterium]